MVIQDTYSPLASSSQISKKTIRSYLQWHGPAVGRVRAVSLVAGTMQKAEKDRDKERQINIELIVDQ